MRLHTGKVAGCLRHAAQSLVLTNSIDSVVNSLQGIDKTTSRVIVDNRFWIVAAHAPYHLGIRHMEFIIDFCGEDVPVGTDVFLDSLRDGKYEKATTGNSIMQTATMQAYQMNILITLHLLIDETGNDLQTIGTLLVDIIT